MLKGIVIMIMMVMVGLVMIGIKMTSMMMTLTDDDASQYAYMGLDIWKIW